MNINELMFKIIDSPINPEIAYIIYIDNNDNISMYDISVQIVEKEEEGYEIGCKEIKDDIITIEKITISEVVDQLDSKLIEDISTYDKTHNFEAYLTLSEFQNFGE